MTCDLRIDSTVLEFASAMLVSSSISSSNRHFSTADVWKLVCPPYGSRPRNCVFVRAGVGYEHAHARVHVNMRLSVLHFFAGVWEGVSVC